ncbi:hypothetical protein [Tenacibaculum halocynthiae]|uniref:hypothetical protein n=1 Tax=Tenacibaculum halocynthiae TaxID=1254437 RepID=UPI0038938873
MKEDRIDKIIKSKLDNRSIEPSNSAWERLSNQLDENQYKTKNKKKIYYGYAASLLLLLSIGFSYFKFNSKEKIKPILVNTKLEILKVDTLKSIDNLINEETITIAKQEYIPIPEVKIEKNNLRKIDRKINIKKNEDTFIKVDKEKNVKIETLIASASKEKSKKPININTIKVSGKDLLFAVTHNVDEVKEYYAKHKLNRNKIINTIERELKKSNLKINPETILAEVESDLINDQFRGSFMRKIKLKISDIAIAVADRNK